MKWIDASDCDGSRSAPGEGMSTEAYPHAVGDVVRGVVRGVRPFGVFVRVDGAPARGKDALLHRDNCGDDVRFSADDDDEAIKHALEYFFPIGSGVYAKVTSVREDDKRPGEWRVSLDASAADQETGADLDPDGTKMLERRRSRADDGANGGGGRPRFGTGDGGNASGAPAFHPELHKVYKGKCRSVKPVGVFVEIRGFRRGAVSYTHLTLPTKA